MAAGLASSGLECRFSKRKKQNIVLVTMDTTRKDHLGCYGYELPTCRNLDTFARQSLVFEDCYSTTNRTLPSHASILTGLHPYNHGVLEQRYRSLHPEIISLAGILSKHGYNTAAITSVGFMNGNTIGNGFQKFHAPRETERSAEKTTNIAINLLDLLELTDESFFIWLHYWDPHYPYAPPNEYNRMFFKGAVTQERLQHLIYGLYGKGEDCKLEHSDNISSKMKLTEKDHDAIISGYDGEIAYMDHHVGRFIDALKSKRVYDKSIVVFTADHGESLFDNDPGLLGHNLIYEPVVRIPLIIRNPNIQSGRIEGLVQNIDIAPTLLNWIGLEAPQMDGKDMNPLIFKDRTIREDILLTEAEARFVGILSGKYKMRMLTARREEPLPIPQSWKDEARKLPRIDFDPQPPSMWSYDETNGIIMYAWQYPLECNDTIDRFSREVVYEGAIGPDHVATFGEVAGRTTEMRILSLVNKRNWDKQSAHLPAFLRIVGKDKNGRKIATSEIVQFALNSPLGIERELYDLSTDPDEKRNIAKEKPDVVESLESRLREFGERNLRAIEDGPEILRGKISRQAEMSEEDIERLKAVGYVR